MANVRVDRRLYLTADRRTLVEEGDPQAAFLWAPDAGFTVTEEEAARVGYQPDKRAAEAYAKHVKEAKVGTAAPDLTELIGKKEAPRPEDKNMGKPADKSAGKPETK